MYTARHSQKITNLTPSKYYQRHPKGGEINVNKAPGMCRSQNISSSGVLATRFGEKALLLPLGRGQVMVRSFQHTTGTRVSKSTSSGWYHLIVAGWGVGPRFPHQSRSKDRKQNKHVAMYVNMIQYHVFLLPHDTPFLTAV